MKIFFQTDPPIQVHQSRINKCPPSFPQSFYWYGGRRSKPGRPSKKVARQIETIDAAMRQSTGNISSEEERNSADTLKSGDTARTLPEHQEELLISDPTVNNKSSNNCTIDASPTPDTVPSSSIVTSNQDKRPPKTVTRKQSQKQCPYFLRSHQPRNNNIQEDAWDKLFQGRK